MEFKSLIIVIVVFKILIFCLLLVWAVDLGVQITDVGRSLDIGSFCPAMTSLSRCLEEAAFSISISSSVNCPSQETEVTSSPTRPVENVVITMKGLQDRNHLLLDGRTVENKGKLFLIEIFPSVQKHDI